ncbi:MAG: GGDEF domain-containing protein [Armatimonadota bacterium]
MSKRVADEIEREADVIMEAWRQRLPADSPLADEVAACFDALVALLREGDDERLRQEAQEILYGSRSRGVEPAELLAMLFGFFEVAWPLVAVDVEVPGEVERAELWMAVKIVSCTLLAMASEHQDEQVSDCLRRLEEVSDRLRRYETADPLTGVHSRARLEALLAEEVDRARRYEAALSLLIIHLDAMERVNEQHGFAAGDDVLRGVAETLVQRCRRVDHVARYAGNTFAVILPETGAEGASGLAEGLRAQLAADDSLGGRQGLSKDVTASLGLVALAPGSDLTGRDLLEAALRAAAEAKSSGGNRVVTG